MSAPTLVIQVDRTGTARLTQQRPPVEFKIVAGPTRARVIASDGRAVEGEIPATRLRMEWFGVIFALLSASAEPRLARGEI